jgi:hypothetical protein
MIDKGTYKGIVKNGVVILPQGAVLPEGAVVDVHPSQVPRRGRWIETDRPALDLTAQQAELDASELASMAAATSELPMDMADEHDHYLHGLPRR